MIRTPLKMHVVSDREARLYDANGTLVAEIRHKRADDWASYITMAVNMHAKFVAACHTVKVAAQEALDEG